MSAADRPLPNVQLDELVQAKIQDALNTLMKGRTTIAIAHRSVILPD